MKKSNCINCGEIYEARSYQIKMGRKYCSIKCRGLASRGKKVGKLTREKLSTKGKERWVAGAYSLESRYKMGWARGKKFSKIHKKRLAVSKLGSGNPMWKENIQLRSLHKWVERHKFRVKFCESCNKATPYDLANISGKYKRDVNDFEWLCRRCHMRSDGRLERLHAGNCKIQKASRKVVKL